MSDGIVGGVPNLQPIPSGDIHAAWRRTLWCFHPRLNVSMLVTNAIYSSVASRMGEYWRFWFQSTFADMPHTLVGASTLDLLTISLVLASSIQTYTVAGDLSSSSSTGAMRKSPFSIRGQLVWCGWRDNLRRFLSNIFKLCHRFVLL